MFCFSTLDRSRHFAHESGVLPTSPSGALPLAADMHRGAATVGETDLDLIPQRAGNLAQRARGSVGLATVLLTAM
jgi:hypothetical protein